MRTLLALFVRHAFAEDREVLAAVHKGMASKRTPNINLPSDSGPLRFRHQLEKLIVQEQQNHLTARTRHPAAEPTLL